MNRQARPTIDSQSDLLASRSTASNTQKPELFSFRGSPYSSRCGALKKARQRRPQASVNNDGMDSSRSFIGIVVPS
jgi:hypothetical protein